MEYEFLRHTLYRPWGRVNSGEKYQTIEQISLSHLQIFAVRQRYLSEEAELVHGMETMQM